MILVDHGARRSKLVMNTSGRAATLDEAKAQFLRNWQKCQQRLKRDH
jgi:hypothetical protein